MRFGLKDEEIELILGVFRDFPKVTEIIIFGSRTGKAFRYNSDIDLAVRGVDFDLQGAIRLKAKLEELPLPYTFDVVGMEYVMDPALLEQITKHGVVLYARQQPAERVSDSGPEKYGLKN